MFKYDVPYEDKIQKLEFLEIDASGIGEILRFVKGRLDIQGYYGKHTQATANAIIYDGGLATDHLNVNIHQLASKGPVINILGALSGAYIVFSSGIYQKLGLATASALARLGNGHIAGVDQHRAGLDGDLFAHIAAGGGVCHHQLRISWHPRGLGPLSSALHQFPVATVRSRSRRTAGTFAAVSLD